MIRFALLWWLLGKLAAIWNFFRSLSPKHRAEQRAEKEREEEEDIYGTD